MEQGTKYSQGRAGRGAGRRRRPFGDPLRLSSRSSGTTQQQPAPAAQQYRAGRRRRPWYAWWTVWRVDSSRRQRTCRSPGKAPFREGPGRHHRNSAVHAEHRPLKSSKADVAFGTSVGQQEPGARSRTSPRRRRQGDAKNQPLPCPVTRGTTSPSSEVPSNGKLSA